MSKYRQQEAKTIENTELYKTQYEELLHEYNQYLEDLEAVQTKLKGLESLKTTYEEENSSLRALCERYQSKADEMQARVEEVEAAKLGTSSVLNNELDMKIEEMKLALATEKEKSIALEHVVKDRDSVVEELQSSLEELKGYTEIAEKQDSERKEKDQIPNESDVVEMLQQENSSLRQQLENKKVDDSCDSDLASNMMVEVLNEKTRENSQLKKENVSLMNNLAEEQRKISVLKDAREKDTSEKNEMGKAAVHKLSQIIKDRDIEIEALKNKNESLLTVLQTNEDDLQKQTEEREKSSLVLKAKVEECSALQSSLEDFKSYKCHNKTVTDNSNEILILKDKIHELERKLNLANIKNEMIKESREIDNQKLKKLENRKRFHSESIEAKENLYLSTPISNIDSNENEKGNYVEEISSLNSRILEKEAKILEMSRVLKEKEESIICKHEELRTNNHKVDSMELRLSEADKSLEYYRLEMEKSLTNIETLQNEKQNLLKDTDKLKLCLEEKQHDLEMAQRNLHQLTEMLDEKSNKSESQQLERLQNLAAIQELQAKISEMSRDRDSAKIGLAEKEREMVGLRKEVNSVIDKKKRLEQELERLKQHLVTIEDSYTQEAIESEERERELRKKLQAVEENLRISSANSSDSSKAAHAKETSLESKLIDITQENSEMRNRLFSVESEFGAQKRAMENLNLALEGFQHEKVNDLKRAEMMYDAKMAEEIDKRSVLERQIIVLEQKLLSASEGLAAAHRLGDQLEAKSKIISTLRQEIKLREDLLKKARQEIEANSGKVILVKYLAI